MVLKAINNILYEDMREFNITSTGSSAKLKKGMV